MANEHNIVRYSADELRAMRARGESQTNWERVRAKIGQELDRDIAADPDWKDVPKDWYLHAEAVMPVPKTPLSLRLDHEVVDWFKQQGPGYQTRINAVLRSFMEHAKQKRA